MFGGWEREKREKIKKKKKEKWFRMRMTLSAEVFRPPF